MIPRQPLRPNWYPRDHDKDPVIGPILQATPPFQCAKIDRRLKAIRELVAKHNGRTWGVERSAGDLVNWTDELKDDLEAVAALACLAMEEARDALEKLRQAAHDASVVAIQRGPRPSAARNERLMPARATLVEQRHAELNAAKEKLVQLPPEHPLCPDEVRAAAGWLMWWTFRGETEDRSKYDREIAELGYVWATEWTPTDDGEWRRWAKPAPEPEPEPSDDEPHKPLLIRFMKP